MPFRHQQQQPLLPLQQQLLLQEDALENLPRGSLEAMLLLQCLLQQMRVCKMASLSSLWKFQVGAGPAGAAGGPPDAGAPQGLLRTGRLLLQQLQQLQHLQHLQRRRGPARATAARTGYCPNARKRNARQRPPEKAPALRGPEGAPEGPVSKGAPHSSKRHPSSSTLVQQGNPQLHKQQQQQKRGSPLLLTPELQLPPPTVVLQPPQVLSVLPEEQQRQHQLHWQQQSQRAQQHAQTQQVMHMRLLLLQAR